MQLEERFRPDALRYNQWETNVEGNPYMGSPGRTSLIQHWFGLQASGTDQPSSRRSSLHTKIMAFFGSDYRLWPEAPSCELESYSTRGPAGNRATTGSLSATSRMPRCQLSHEDDSDEDHGWCLVEQKKPNKQGREAPTPSPKIISISGAKNKPKN